METGSGFGYSPLSGQQDPWWCQPIPTQIGRLGGDPSMLQDNLLSAERASHEPECNFPLWGEVTVKVKDVGPGTKPKV